MHFYFKLSPQCWFSRGMAQIGLRDKDHCPSKAILSIFINVTPASVVLSIAMRAVNEWVVSSSPSSDRILSDV